jgi:amino-acid N-acetyltransferase
MIYYRKATLNDIVKMQQLVKDEVNSGVILYRNDDEVATNIRSYTVAHSKDELLGYGALHIHTKELAEVRSLVVQKEQRGNGIGAKLVKKLLQEAHTLKLKQVFALTYTKRFFERLEFKEIPKESLPQQKIWADCINCKYFPTCNEISLIINL